MKLEKTAEGTLRADILAPSDMHHHFRDGLLMEGVTVPFAQEQFYRCLAMPNLSPRPVATMDDAVGYHDRLVEASCGPSRHNTRPLEYVMTTYLTSETRDVDVHACAACRAMTFGGIKYYPRGVTTNSQHGLPDPSEMWRATPVRDALRALAACGRPLLVHAADAVDRQGRVIDPYDQERYFLTQTLPRIREAHPDLRVSLEHVSTHSGATLVADEGGPLLGCSLTAHHLLLDRRDVYRGGLNPHSFWWPVIQRERDREALRHLLDLDLPHVWLGTDSAPHPRSSKESQCCPGGVLTSHVAMQLYAEVAAGIRGMDCEADWEWFERFASVNGPAWFGLDPTPPDRRVVLSNEPTRVPRFLVADAFGQEDDVVVPFRRGETIPWSCRAS